MLRSKPRRQSRLNPRQGRSRLDALSGRDRLDGTVYPFHEAGAPTSATTTDPHGRFVQRCVAATSRRCPRSRAVPPRQGRRARRGGVRTRRHHRWRHGRQHDRLHRDHLRRGEVVLARIEVPEHYWYSRWRWQSAPRPITGKIEDLQADGLLPRFDTSLATTHPWRGPRICADGPGGTDSLHAIDRRARRDRTGHRGAGRIPAR